MAPNRVDPQIAPQVRPQAAAAYAPYAPFQFIRYWTELWRTYEDRMGGRAWDVDPERYRLATAAHMSVPLQRYARRAKAGAAVGRGAVKKLRLKRPAASLSRLRLAR